MQEVRVESLEGLERREGRVLLSANAGLLSIVSPEGAWERATADAVPGPEPAPEELAELGETRARRCGAGRFEMPSELWQILSGGLGWRDVETFANREE